MHFIIYNVEEEGKDVVVLFLNVNSYFQDVVIKAFIVSENDGT